MLESGAPPTLPRRRQATLYLPFESCETIELIRSRYNPVQFRLIRAHVTLCREDEVIDWGELENRISRLKHISVTLCFGEPFRDRNFVCLPTTGSNSSFHELRKSLLATDGFQPRTHQPHLTLIHPRNGHCSDKAFDEIQQSYQPFNIELKFITLIEQVGDEPWKNLIEYGK